MGRLDAYARDMAKRAIARKLKFLSFAQIHYNLGAARTRRREGARVGGHGVPRGDGQAAHARLTPR